MSQQPAHKLRSGVLQLAIWKNQGERGHWYSITPSRSYQKEDAWHEADSYGFDDLLNIAKLFDQAHTWITRQMQADHKFRKDRQEADTGEE